MNKFLALAAFFGLFAVIIGAFGAHGLERQLSEHAMQRFHTGVDYQFYHVMALFAVSLLSLNHDKIPRSLQLSGIFFALGILLFSGSLYLYAYTGKTVYGMITPVGGLGFISGWLCLLIYAFKHNRLQDRDIK